LHGARRRAPRFTDTGYETLLYDAMIGDSTLFHGADNVEAGSTVLEPVLEVWEGSPAGLATYPEGSWGPDGVDALMAGDGRQWRRPGGASR
jgi:glucose-6-phosphate 1-dehydrogenase